jgi:hypothetical protein
MKHYSLKEFYIPFCQNNYFIFGETNNPKTLISFFKVKEMFLHEVTRNHT